MSSKDEFTAWADEHRSEVARVRELLDIPIPDEIWTLREHLVQVESLNARMTSILAEADRFYTESMERELRALAAGAISERRIMLNYLTKSERQTRDVIKGLCRAMEYRLMLGMSLLKTLNAELASSNVVHRGGPRMVRALTTPSAFRG